MTAPSDAAITRWAAATTREAARAWPELAPAELEAFLRAVVTALVASSSAPDLDALRKEDLVLAHACLSGSERAIAELERRLGPVLDRVFERLGLTVASAHDARSAVREALLYGSKTARPLLAGYSGRGALESWARSIAVRTALADRERAERHVPADELDVLAGDEDPELTYLRAPTPESSRPPSARPWRP